MYKEKKTRLTPAVLCDSKLSPSLHTACRKTKCFAAPQWTNFLGTTNPVVQGHVEDDDDDDDDDDSQADLRFGNRFPWRTIEEQ